MTSRTVGADDSRIAAPAVPRRGWTALVILAAALALDSGSVAVGVGLYALCSLLATVA